MIAPITHDGKGTLLNGDVKMFAYEIARTLTIAYDVTIINVLSEENGVLTNGESPGGVIPVLRRAQYKLMCESGEIDPVAYPNINNAFSAIDHGVKEVVLINAARFSDLKGGTHIK